jgi:hypothetical protein
MIAANEITQHLTIFRPTGLFGLGFISGFVGGFALLFFAI